MGRTLLNLASAASLALCVAVVALWIRSYSVGDGLLHKLNGGPPNVGGHVTVTSAWGRIQCKLQRWTYEPSVTLKRMPGPLHSSSSLASGDYLRPTSGLLGFDYQNETRTPPITPRPFTIRTVLLAAPHALFAVLFAALPGWWLARFRRRRLAEGRRACQRCVACGYDLRATPHGECCPECGALPVSDGGDVTTRRWNGSGK